MSEEKLEHFFSVFHQLLILYKINKKVYRDPVLYMCNDLVIKLKDKHDIFLVLLKMTAENLRVAIKNQKHPLQDTNSSSQNFSDIKESINYYLEYYEIFPEDNSEINDEDHPWKDVIRYDCEVFNNILFSKSIPYEIELYQKIILNNCHALNKIFSSNFNFQCSIGVIFRVKALVYVLELKMNILEQYLMDEKNLKVEEMLNIHKRLYDDLLCIHFEN